MFLRRISLWLLVLLALAAPAPAYAIGGNYAFDGGTPAEQAQVEAALDASAFDWSVVQRQITIHIAPGIDSEARPGHVWLDADLLDSGRFSWGVVQHEYAHQVDFFLLTPQARTWLVPQLGAQGWWQARGMPHAAAGCERFASTLAWSYWQSRDNVMRPDSRDDEAAALPPAQFRALVARVLGLPQPGTFAFRHR